MHKSKILDNYIKNSSTTYFFEATSPRNKKRRLLTINMNSSGNKKSKLSDQNIKNKIFDLSSNQEETSNKMEPGYNTRSNKNLETNPNKDL